MEATEAKQTIRAACARANEDAGPWLHKAIRTATVDCDTFPAGSDDKDLREAEDALYDIIQAAAAAVDAIRGTRNKRGSMQKKVRKALGYTYP